MPDESLVVVTVRVPNSIDQTVKKEAALRDIAPSVIWREIIEGGIRNKELSHLIKVQYRTLTLCTNLVEHTEPALLERADKDYRALVTKLES